MAEELTYAQKNYRKNRVKLKAKARDRYHNKPGEKERVKKYNKEYHEKNLEERNRKDKEWYYSNHEKKLETRHKWTDKNREEINRRARIRYHKNKQRINSTWKDRDNPLKRSARSKLAYAVRSGKVIKPDVCQDCKEKKNRKAIGGHHKDYTKPFDVDWLCMICHGKRHRLEVSLVMEEKK